MSKNTKSLKGLLSVVLCLNFAHLNASEDHVNLSQVTLTAQEFTDKVKVGNNAESFAPGNTVTISGSINQFNFVGSGKNKLMVITLEVTPGSRVVQIEFSPSYLQSPEFLDAVGLKPEYSYFSSSFETEFKLSNGNILARVVTTISSSRSYSYDGGPNRSYKSQSKYETDWKPILLKGQGITVKGKIKKIGLRNEINEGEIISSL